MASLAHLLGRVGRGIAKVPRVIDDAMTDEEIDPVTGQPFRRPSRLAQGLGEVLRAGVVAAGSPTPGAVGTAQDIFGGLKAVEADRNARQDRASLQRQRQLTEQAAAQRNKREELESKAELEWRQAQVAREKAAEAKANRDANKAPGADLQAKISAMEDIIGRPLNEREKQTVLGLFGPQYDQRQPSSGPQSRNPMEYARELMQENDSFDTPEGAENDPTGDRGLLNERIINRTLGAKDPAPKVMTLESGVMVVDPRTAKASPVKGPDDKQVKPPARNQPFTRPPRDRVKTETRADGKRVIVNLDTGKQTELFDAPAKPGKGGSPSWASGWDDAVKNAGKPAAGSTSSASADPKGRFKEGDVVMHNGKRAMIKSFDKDGNPYIEYLK